MNLFYIHLFQIVFINFDLLFNTITHNKSHLLKKLAIIHSWKISKDSLLEFFITHEKKNVGPITFHYEKHCTVFHGINEFVKEIMI